MEEKENPVIRNRIKLEDVIPDHIKQNVDISSITNNIYIAEDDPRLVAWRKSVEEFEKNNKENK